MKNTNNKLVIRDLGLQDYRPVWQAMQKFTAERDESTADELWYLEHPPVFTMGLNGKKKHLLNVGDIPVIDIDRGGQVTYHGPGQIILYTLIDLKRLHIGVKGLVSAIEQAIIQLLKKNNITAEGKENAPGVYVNDAKIAALGLRIKRNKSYHGLSLNVDMNLAPFQKINPCGYKGMAVTQIKNFEQQIDMKDLKNDLTTYLAQLLGYSSHDIIHENKKN